MQRRTYGRMADGTIVEQFRLASARGVSVDFLSYGGTITAINVPDRRGRTGNVVLACRSLNDYERNAAFLGALIGRYANRIGGAAFTLDGVTYRLGANEGENTLHGGDHGFDKRLWTVEELAAPTGEAVRLSYVSTDGEEGFPGTLSVSVTYALDERGAFTVAYEATSDKPTVVNLTSHPYFNLSGEGSGSIKGHRLTINADRYLLVAKGLVPTGVLAPVADTPFDFRTPAEIGARLASDHPQLRLTGGYDHAYVVNQGDGGLTPVARAHDPASGRTLEIHSDQPSVQFYTGNGLDGTIVGPAGKPYGPHAAFCLETQHFPDSPNQPSFPTTVLRPGETYRTRTVHTFGVEAG